MLMSLNGTRSVVFAMSLLFKHPAQPQDGVAQALALLSQLLESFEGFVVYRRPAFFGRAGDIRIVGSLFDRGFAERLVGFPCNEHSHYLLQPSISIDRASASMTMTSTTMPVSPQFFSGNRSGIFAMSLLYLTPLSVRCRA